MNVFGRVLQKNVYPIQLLFSDSVASDSVQFSDSVAVSCQKFSFFAIICFADNQRQCEGFDFREFHSFVFFQSPRIAATPFFFLIMQPSTSNHLPFAFLKRNSYYILVCPKTKKPFTQSSSCFQIASLQIASSFRLASLSPVKSFHFLPSFVLRIINVSVRGLISESFIHLCFSIRSNSGYSVFFLIMQPSISNHLPFAFLKQNSSYISVCPKTKKPFTQSSSCFQVMWLQIASSFRIASLSPVKSFHFLPLFVLRIINVSVRGLISENFNHLCFFNPLK